MSAIIKKSVNLMVLFILLSSMLFPGAGLAKSKFKDVLDSYWALDEIAFLVEKGVIGGYNDGTFRPGENITRGQAVIMISRALKADASKYPNPGLKDVTEKSPYFQAVKVLMGEGVLAEVVKEKQLQPSKALTRGEMASILTKAYDLGGTYDGEFKDVEKSHFAYDDIKILAANNITTGFSDKTFKPNKVLTRVDFSVMLARTVDDRFKAGEVLELQKVDWVEIDTERDFIWLSNMAHLAIRAKSDNQYSRLKESLEPEIEYFSWGYFDKPITIQQFLKNSRDIYKIGNLGFDLKTFTVDEISDPTKYVIAVFYDKDKKPVAYQDNTVTLKPRIIAHKPSEMVDDDGFFRIIDTEDGYHFIRSQIPENYQTLGSYFYVHGSYTDFTYEEAISAEGHNMIKIAHTLTQAPEAYTNFKELKNKGKFNIMLIILDADLKPVGYVKRELDLK